MRFHKYVVLSGLTFAATAMCDDIIDFSSAVPKWSNDKMSGVAEMIEASIEGDAFTICYKQSTGTNYVFSVNDTHTGELEDIAAISAMKIHGVAYSSSAERLAISFLDLHGVSKTILFGTDGLPMRTFPGTTMVAFDSAGISLAVAGAGLPWLEVANLSSGESTRVFVCDVPPNAIAIATENNGAEGVVGAVGAMGSISVWDLPTGANIFTQLSEGEGDMMSIAFAPGCTYVGGGGEDGGSSMDAGQGSLSVFALPGSGEVTGQRVYYGVLEQAIGEKIHFTSNEEHLLVSGQTDEGMSVTAIDWRNATTASVQIAVDNGSTDQVNDFAFSVQEMIWATAGVNGVIAFTPGTTSACQADLDGDGVVNGGDLASLLGEWQESNASHDFDGNGLVDGGDLSILLASWGPCDG
jgi:WD40 repeat protein